jgi:peptide-methionine (S)-S-oxide reductase
MARTAETQAIAAEAFYEYQLSGFFVVHQRKESRLPVASCGESCLSRAQQCRTGLQPSIRTGMLGPLPSLRKANTMTASTERAVLAGGCFWGMQDLIRKMPGVISTRVGYSGGDVANATYRHHGTHAEAIEIVFDPRIISYRTLLEFFFQIHDPTTRNRQGNDVGTSYRSGIFYASDEQKRVAEDTIADVEASGLWPGKVVTELAPVGPFWEAEPEHQDYLEHYPDGYTCHFVRPGWKLPHRTQVKAS